MYVGNLDPKIDEEILWELMVQCGPIQTVSMPRDKITNTHQGYGFVEFKNEEDADYSIKIMNMIRLFGKPIRCNKASQDRRQNEVGANLFVGNLEPEVDEKMLYETFSAFGVLLFAKVMRDPDTGAPRGFGFISYDNFESSDAALAAMNGQFLCNRPISVSYAYKKETRGERHGSAAERLIAANRPQDIKIPAAVPAVTPGKPGGMPGMPGMMGGMPSGMPAMRPPMLPPGMPPPPGMGGSGVPQMIPPPGMPMR